MDNLVGEAFLSRLYPSEILESILPVGHDWQSYSDNTTQESWSLFPEEVRSFYIHQGEQAQASPWPQLSNEVFLSLRTPCHVEVKESGKVILLEASLPDGRASGHGQILYSPGQLTIEPQVISLKDPWLRSVWDDRLVRLVFRVIRVGTEGELHLKIKGGYAGTQ
jgi:hypothetical protein